MITPGALPDGNYDPPETTMERIREQYRVPAQKGGRVRYTGAPSGPVGGTITGTSDTAMHLMIVLDGDNWPLPFHPTWELTYLDPADERKDV